MAWLDHAKLKVAREVKPGEEFAYVFDLGDNWRHRCSVEPGKFDPREEWSWAARRRRRIAVFMSGSGRACSPVCTRSCCGGTTVAAGQAHRFAVGL
jgi:hypothetical protein